MNKVTRINLTELDQYITGKCGGKEFYFGCWSPEPHEFNTGSAPVIFRLNEAKTGSPLEMALTQSMVFFFRLKTVMTRRL